MKTYKNRYQARKAMVGNQAIVKVCSNQHEGQDYGYVLMDYAYHYVWRKQK